MTDPTPATIAAALFAREGTGAAWGLKIEEVAEGCARVSMLIRADMTNGHRTVHGGMIFALAGRSGAYSVSSTTSEGKAVAQFQGHSRAIGGAVIAGD